MCESFRVRSIYSVFHAIILLYHPHNASHSENRAIKYHNVKRLHCLFSIDAKNNNVIMSLSFFYSILNKKWVYASLAKK